VRAYFLGGKRQHERVQVSSLQENPSRRKSMRKPSACLRHEKSI